MDSVSAAHVSSTDLMAVLIFLVVFLVVFTSLGRPSGLPPGPPVFPGLGNLPSFFRSDPLHVFKSWSETYGNVYSLYLGKRLCIVLTGYTTIREAIVLQGSIFSDRPFDPFVNKFLVGNRGIGFASGNEWKTERKFLTTALQQIHFGRPAFEDTIHSELRSLLMKLESFNGEAVDPEEDIKYSTANIIKVIVTGERAEFRDPAFTNFLRITEKSMGLVPKTSLVMSTFPWMLHFPGDLFGLKYILDGEIISKGYLNQLYSSHIKLPQDDSPRNVMDAYAKQKRDKTAAAQVFLELFAAGLDTTATTLRWILLYLLHYPDTQTKCRDEIYAVLGKHNLPTMNDKLKLPYVSATILEGLRISNAVMMGIPHAPATDTTFRGYTIPKGTSVILNMQSVFHDPGVFPDPSIFNPDRFLNEAGEVVVPEQLTPFGMGRRVCPGEAAAKMELFLFLTAILQRFSVVAENNVPPPLKGSLAITYSPDSYKIRFQKCT